MDLMPKKLREEMEERIEEPLPPAEEPISPEEIDQLPPDPEEEELLPPSPPPPGEGP